MRNATLFTALAVSFVVCQASAQDRGGPYHTDWSDVPSLENQYEHEGRAAGWFEDAGRGIIRFFQRDAGFVRVQDAGDTKNFDRLTVDNRTILRAKEEPRKNGNIFKVWLDKGRHTFRTYQIAGLPVTRQDGYAVCRK